MGITRTFLSVFLALGALTFGSPTHAALELGTDLFTRGFGYLGHADFNIRTHTYLFFGTKDFAFGGVVGAEALSSTVKDFTGGGGLRIGDTFFVQLDGGYFLRIHDGTAGQGIAGAIRLGWRIKWFRIVLPLNIKYIHSGLTRRVTTDFVPWIGFKFISI